MNHRKWFALIFMVVIFTLLATSCDAEEDHGKVVGVIIMREFSASNNYINIDDINIREGDFSVFDAFGITSGIAYFAVLSEIEDNSSWMAQFSPEGAIVGNAVAGLVNNTHTVQADFEAFVTPALSMSTFNYTEIRQDASGRLFTRGGISISFVPDTERIVHTYTARDDFSVIHATLHVMYTPVKIATVQMDETDNLLLRSEYAPSSLPVIYPIASNAAYVIIETHRQSPHGEIIITRDIISPIDESFTTFSAREDGVIITHVSQIEISEPIFIESPIVIMEFNP